MQLLITLLLDAVILMLLLRFLLRQRTDFVQPLITAVVAAIAAAGLESLFGTQLGPYGPALIVGGCVAATVGFLFKTNLQTSLIIGGLFVVAKIGLSVLLPSF